MPIGPDLPPHLLAKRKRQDESQEDDAVDRAQKPNSEPDLTEKRRRVVGPALPLGPLDERPAHEPDDDGDSSSDDDFGPAPPTGEEPLIDHEAIARENAAREALETKTKKPQRDEWMMMPPQQDDLAARMDPSKQRARKFNTGKSARGGGSAGGSSSIWTETVEEKQKRLQNEVLGITGPGSSTGPDTSKKSNAQDLEKTRKIREYSEKNRGPSLYTQHQKRQDVEEDDPSKRAFDREKDMGLGLQLNKGQQRAILNNSKTGLSSRFASSGHK